MSHVVDDDRGALPRQFENDRLTDPAVAAGDDRNLVLQRHSCSSIVDVGSLRPLRHAPAGVKAASVWLLRNCRAGLRALFGRNQLADQVGDEPGPAGLMRSAAAAAIVAVEVLVEQDVVLEVWIGLKFLVAAEDGAPARPDRAGRA